MYAEDKHVSARQRWQQSTPRQRVKMLRDAGYLGGLGHAYQDFDHLCPTMKLDLNFVAEREMKQAADNQGEADAQPAGIEEELSYA
jgi:hypothetical protein